MSQTSLQALLAQLKNASRINLSDMYIGDQQLDLLLENLQSNTNLKCLELRGNSITPQGFQSIFQTLNQAPQLKILSLDWNSIGSDPIGMEALGEFLLYNNTVVHIGLSNNKINGDDIDPLAEALRSNKTLLSIDLKWNELRQQGGIKLLDALQENETLLYMELGGSDVYENEYNQIQEILTKNHQSNPIQKHKILEVDDFIDPQVTAPQQKSTMLAHLEQMLEKERLHTLSIKQRLERELDELANRDRTVMRMIDDVEINSKELDVDNKSARMQIAKLKDEYEIIQRQQEDQLRSMEEKIRGNAYILTELEKKHRSNLDRMLNETNFRARDLIRDWENRCRALEDRSKTLANENEVVDEDLRQLNEKQIQLQITYDQEIRELRGRVEDEEYSKFNQLAKSIEQKISGLTTSKDMIARRNMELQKDYSVRETQGKDQLREMQEELSRLKDQNNEFTGRNQDYRAECDRLKGQAKVKESANEKLEQEIKQLNDQITNKRNMHENQVKALLDEQAADRKIWDDDRQKEQARLSDLERQVRDSCSENERLRKDISKLQEIMQSELASTLQKTFFDNSFI